MQFYMYVFVVVGLGKKFIYYLSLIGIVECIVEI